jgi:hypothetical protein
MFLPQTAFHALNFPMNWIEARRENCAVTGPENGGVCASEARPNLILGENF